MDGHASASQNPADTVKALPIFPHLIVKEYRGRSGSIPDKGSRDMGEPASLHGAPSLPLKLKQRNSAPRASQEAARTCASDLMSIMMLN